MELRIILPRLRQPPRLSGATQVAQIDSMTLAGTAEVGDVYGVNINDQFKITYSVKSGDTITTIRNELLNLLNSNEDISEILVASEGDEQSQQH